MRSNLKRRSSCFGTVQVRLRTHTTLQRVIHCPREIWVVAAVPLEANFKALNPVVLPCSGRCAGATDQRRVGALRLRWLSCARRRLPVNLWPAQPSVFAPAHTAAGSAPCARRIQPTLRVPADYRAWSRRRFIVHANEKLSAFIELERQVLPITFYLECIRPG